MPDILCPKCKTPTYDEEALSCHFCGERLPRSSSGFIGAMSGAGMKWVLVTVAILMAIVMIATMI